MKVQPTSSLTPRPVSWLWTGRLALGKLSILDGDPGLGKSLIALDLCARLSTGRAMPDGSPGLPPSPAIILNGEDGAADTIVPRLQALGADLDRVFVLQPEEGDPYELLRLPSGTGLLERALAQTGARLVVIDPVMAFLDPSVLSASDQSVRRVLLPLARLAEKYSCVILLVRHLNKRGTRQSLYRGGGSIGFLGACRSGWLAAPHPKEPGQRVLAQVKNNLAPPQPSLAYAVHDRPGAPPALEWRGACAWPADHLLARAPRPDSPHPARERARAFLAAFLEKGPRTTHEIWTAAREEGLSARTLQRARHMLKVRTARAYNGEQRRDFWFLPVHEPPECARPDPAQPELEAWLADLHERFPPRNPLDEGDE